MDKELMANRIYDILMSKIQIEDDVSKCSELLGDEWNAFEEYWADSHYKKMKTRGDPYNLMIMDRRIEWVRRVREEQEQEIPHTPDIPDTPQIPHIPQIPDNLEQVLKSIEDWTNKDECETLLFSLELKDERGRVRGLTSILRYLGKIGYKVVKRTKEFRSTKTNMRKIYTQYKIIFPELQ